MPDQELLANFTSESSYMLDEVEPTLIELQLSAKATGSLDSDTLNAIFRLFHSMKGSAGFLGLTAIGQITHQAETLLDLFRKGKAILGSSHTNVLCRTIDLLREILVETDNWPAQVAAARALGRLGDLDSFAKQLPDRVWKAPGHGQEVARHPPCDSLARGSPPISESPS